MAFKYPKFQREYDAINRQRRKKKLVVSAFFVTVALIIAAMEFKKPSSSTYKISVIPPKQSAIDSEKNAPISSPPQTQQMTEPQPEKVAEIYWSSHQDARESKSSGAHARSTGAEQLEKIRQQSRPDKSE